MLDPQSCSPFEGDEACAMFNDMNAKLRCNRPWGQVSDGTGFDWQ